VNLDWPPDEKGTVAMTTGPMTSTPDDAGRTDLAEGVPDPTGPINTGHDGAPSFAEHEDVPGASE
jgi:hypothetical protein